MTRFCRIGDLAIALVRGGEIQKHRIFYLDAVFVLYLANRISSLVSIWIWICLTSGDARRGTQKSAK